MVLSALKLPPSFPLDINVNKNLNYRKGHLLCKCRKKAIASKQDCCGTNILIVIFHENEINYDSHLKAQLIFYASLPTNEGFPRFLQHMSNDLPILEVYHVVKDFHVCNWFFSYNRLRILTGKKHHEYGHFGSCYIKSTRYKRLLN